MNNLFNLYNDFFLIIKTPEGTRIYPSFSFWYSAIYPVSENRSVKSSLIAQYCPKIRSGVFFRKILFALSYTQQFAAISYWQAILHAERPIPHLRVRILRKPRKLPRPAPEVRFYFLPIWCCQVRTNNFLYLFSKTNMKSCPNF